MAQGNPRVVTADEGGGTPGYITADDAGGAPGGQGGGTADQGGASGSSGAQIVTADQGGPQGGTSTPDQGAAPASPQAPHLAGHGSEIFHHPSTNRPTASLAAEVRAATPQPMTPPSQAVKAANAAIQPRQRGRVGGLPQKQPTQRIGYFGPRGGGIVNVPGPVER